MEIAGDLRLREQSLHGIYALFGDDGGGTFSHGELRLAWKAESVDGQDVRAV